MTRMQDVVLGEVEKIAADMGVTYVDQTQWANTGKVFLLNDDHQAVLAFTYDFQDTEASILMTDGTVKPVAAIGFTPAGHTRFDLDYVDGATIQGFLAAVNVALDEQ